MHPQKHIILGIHIQDRMNRAGDVQRLFTEYGCSIRMRLGLHEVDEKHCSPKGLILLEMFGDETPIFELRDKLGAIDGVDVKEMIFGHTG